MTIDYITIDDTTYNVPVTSLKRTADFLDKMAERTNDGVLHRELIGVYFNYQLKFGKASMADYAALYDKLTEPKDKHTIIVPTETGATEFDAYFAGITDNLKRISGSLRYWTDLTVNFIAMAPARTP